MKRLGFIHVFQLLVSVGSSLADSLNCGPPPFLREARIIGRRNQTYPVGALLPYECNLGYTEVGTDHLGRCVNDENDQASWHLSINCLPVNCGDPGAIENGARVGDDWTHPNSVEYVCDEGYILNSNEQPFLRHCQANRLWSNHLPSCLVVNCSIPENADYAATVFYDVSFGSKVIYDCGVGRRIEGSAVRECLANGRWTGTTPQCVEIECNRPLENYPHGTVEVLAGTRQNDRIRYECNDGTITFAYCLPDGNWAPPPPLCMTGPVSITTEEQLTTITTTRMTTTITTETPKKRHTYCRWRIFKWICRLIY